MILLAYQIQTILHTYKAQETNNLTKIDSPLSIIVTKHKKQHNMFIGVYLFFSKLSFIVTNRFAIHGFSNFYVFQNRRVISLDLVHRHFPLGQLADTII